MSEKVRRKYGQCIVMTCEKVSGQSGHGRKGRKGTGTSLTAYRNMGIYGAHRTVEGFSTHLYSGFNQMPQRGSNQPQTLSSVTSYRCAQMGPATAIHLYI